MFSCSKENNDQKLPLLIKELIADRDGNCICDPYIDQFEWKKKMVYVLANKGPGCDSFPTFYDQNGDIIIFEAGYNSIRFFVDSRFIKNIWVCK